MIKQFGGIDGLDNLDSLDGLDGLDKLDKLDGLDDLDILLISSFLGSKIESAADLTSLGVNAPKP